MYSVARISTVKMVLDTIQPLIDAGRDIDYVEWDGVSEQYELKKMDLVGLVGFSCTQDDQFHDVTFGIAIMTYQDPDLSRLTELVDLFYNRLRAHEKYDVYHADGPLAGFEVVVFDGTTASPMGQVKSRPTVDIQVSARLTRAGQYRR